MPHDKNFFLSKREIFIKTLENILEKKYLSLYRDENILFRRKPTWH
jgi:hypothetical protein